MKDKIPSQNELTELSLLGYEQVNSRIDYLENKLDEIIKWKATVNDAIIAINNEIEK